MPRSAGADRRCERKGSRDLAVAFLVSTALLLTGCEDPGGGETPLDLARHELDGITANSPLEFTESVWEAEGGCGQHPVDQQPLAQVVTRGATFESDDERIHAANIVRNTQERWLATGSMMDSYAGATFDELVAEIGGIEYVVYSDLRTNGITIQARIPCE